MQEDSDLGDNWQDPKFVSCWEELNIDGKLNWASDNKREELFEANRSKSESAVCDSIREQTNSGGCISTVFAWEELKVLSSPRFWFWSPFSSESKTWKDGVPKQGDSPFANFFIIKARFSLVDFSSLRSWLYNISSVVFKDWSLELEGRLLEVEGWVTGSRTLRWIFIFGSHGNAWKYEMLEFWNLVFKWSKLKYFCGADLAALGQKFRAHPHYFITRTFNFVDNSGHCQWLELNW